MIRIANTQGFTLMELLVAISVFSILTTMVTVNYVSNEKSRMLKQEANKILSGLQKTENMALTGQTIDLVVPIFYEFQIKECIESCFYKIVAGKESGEYQELEMVELKDLSINVAGGGVSLRFSPPRGRMEIVGGGSSIKINVANNSGAYCLEASALSGRLSLSRDNCD